MSKNLGRLFSSLIDLSAPRLGLPCARSDGVSESLSHSNAAMRLVCSSAPHQHQHQHQHQHHPQKQEEEEDASSFTGNKQSPDGENGVESEEDEGEDGVDVNEQTGEVGGPRGPEPTRFGDWERKGRCSDF